MSGATVNFVQNSVNDAASSGSNVIAGVASDQWLETAVINTTVSAPATSESYQFTHWTNSSSPATVYRDAWGRSLNPISFTLYENTTATAHYLPGTRDSDADGVPDWFEIEYYGSLINVSGSDTDGDGLSLLQEYAGGTHPLYPNNSLAGGVSTASSALVTCNLSGYASYTVNQSPLGAVDLSGYAALGTVITTPEITDAEFGYWLVDGVRQQDAWGIALRLVSFTMEAANRVATANFFTGDTDADGVPDAWENYYYGTLSNDATADSDRDGRTMLAEYQAGTSPVFANSLSEGGVAYGDSDLVTVNFAGFSRYTLRSEPAGMVSQSAIVADGTVVTTDAITDASFAYWTLDGVRQQDAWGVPLRQISFTMRTGTDHEAVAFFLSNDTDGDGINDGFEQYYYGTLSNSATSDTDGDGQSLLAEFTAGSSPLFRDTAQAGGVVWADSALVVVNQQIFPADRQRGSGSFFSNPYTNEAGSFALAGGNSAPALGDWDGDGDLDMVVGGVGGAVRFLRNDGSPFAADPVPQTVNDLPEWPGGPVYPALGDWNGDGRADLVVGSNDGLLRFYRATSGGAAPFEWVGNLAIGTGAVRPTLWVKSGGPDLLVLNESTVLHFAKTSGELPYALPATQPNLLGIPVTGGTALSVADTNDDQRADVLASDSAGRLWRFLGQADGSFLLESKVWGGTFNGFRAGLTATVMDFDGDGDPDIIGGGTDGALIFLRNPARHLQISPTVATVGTGESIDFASINNDGTLVWSMGPARSGGSIQAATGRYVAGNTPGIDQVVARNAAGRTGVAWVNVVQRGGQAGLKWRALLVDGRRGPNDPVWPAAHALNSRAREVLKYRGLSDGQIRWLGHGAEADAVPTRAGLASALGGGAVEADTDVLLVYLVDHGRVAPNGDGLFLLSENESVSGVELDNWLDTLQSTRPSLSVVVVVESCFGARVAGPMMSTDVYSARRLVFSSSGANELAHLAANGLVSYSSLWWSGVASGKSLGAAHADAIGAMAGLQTPQSGTGGAVLAAGKLALESVASSGRPVVYASSGDISLQGTQEARLTVDVESGFGIDKVWGVIVPPNYSPSGDEPVVDLPEVQLAKDAATGQWTALVGGFSEGGAPYTVLVQARDVWGQVSMPSLLRVQQATVRNRVIIFAPGEDAWSGASVAGSMAEYARESALLRRVRAEDIKLFADTGLSVDSFYVASAASLKNAIETWANADGQLSALTVFLVGQGSQQGLVCANGDTITPADLKDWLDTQQEASGALVQLIVDADYSGAFVAGAGNPNHRRVIVSSTGPTQRNTFASGRWGRVTRWIWNAIARGRDLRESYGEAADLAGRIAGSVPALFDDSGDGMFTKLQDGLKAINAFVGSAYVTADDPPFIGKASAAMTVASGQSARFWVSDIVMPAGAEPQDVWGEVLGPDGTSRGTVRLWQNVAKARYEGAFGGFTEAGRYLIFIQAGTEGDPALTTPPALVQVHYACVPATGAPVADGLPVLALPTDGQAMDVETDAGQDWRINLVRGQRVAIEAREVTAQRDVALQLIGAGGQVLASADQWGVGFGETISSWEAPADGSYLVRATFATGTGTAGCRVRAFIKYDSGAAAAVSLNLTTQTIAFTPPASSSLSDGALNLVAYASSGLPVRFAVVSGLAALSGNTLNPIAVGVVVIRALQDGSADWESAEPVDRTITISAGVETYETWAQGLFGADYAAQGGRTQDADGDGQSNEAEWVARTNPASATDVLKVDFAAITPSGFTLRWLARQGVTYRMMTSADLQTWTELPNTRIVGTDAQVQVVDPLSARSKVFYRVEVVATP
ncbi:hypothetical protein IMCC26134_00455 [Verrucomicrobia bacterium IMCC26134]|nr:hypothetical protein IMCC26134_00455 [Verrucomicrobia bacterium IMCC26134]